MRADLRHLETKIDRLAASVEARFEGVDGRFDSLEVRSVATDAALANFAASVDARFAQVNQTAATNLALTLSAIEGLAASTESRFARVEETAAANLATLLNALDAKRS